jgi:hypothetical protein
VTRGLWAISAAEHLSEESEMDPRDFLKTPKEILTVISALVPTKNGVTPSPLVNL